MTGQGSIPPVGIWTPVFDRVPGNRVCELAVELEELGYGAIWLPEGLGKDPFIELALLLSATRSIIGATGIANIWARDAVTTACAARSLTDAFPERVLVGLGVSHRSLVSDVRGHRYAKPLEAMSNYLQAVHNAPYTAVRSGSEPRYLLAALGPRMLALAATRTSGAHTYLVTPEHTAGARKELGAAALLCPQQAVILDTNGERARNAARDYLAGYLAMPNYRNNLARLGFHDDLDRGGTDRLIDALVPWGDVALIRQRVRDHLDAGADHVAIHVVVPDSGDPVPREQWRILAPAVVGLSAAPHPASVR
ncbi:TIGR03620 family F420-dependent LLM class oxidoreductase [Mycolicibacterium smegmatis]|uniref:TIGR03620 family F420-dependent LLM class oxidoreductase n=1 Tax=Mycolicibacterium smegmatis TaxID=1772 RepID=UPI001303C73D|nr:TIGR03620 family F420-dependent LLM class oxidoreductase [Mycolicibacterium smegmatis]